MTTLTNKDKRKLLYSVKRLFSNKSLIVPKSIGDIPTKKYLYLELCLTENRTIFLTDAGHEHFRAVVDVIHKADFFNGRAEFSDIWRAWRKVVEKWLSNGLQPGCVDEVVQALEELIVQEIDNHTFVVPLLGIELDGVVSFALGAMTILPMSVDLFDSAGVTHDHTNVPRLLELSKQYFWLKGTMHGTPSVAQQKFSEQAALTVGMLAITAVSMYEWGASGFRIGIVMTAEEATGRSVWFSWDERTRGLTTHYTYRRGQPLPVNKALGNDSDMARMIHRAFAILQADDRSPLEEAIARAVYWYSDAHRDPVLVMKLVKYWSCVEAFFSFENEEITHAVSAGLASILVFGGFHFVPLSEYGTVKKQIADLYSLRSRAVHRGSHNHTTEQHITQFSQWVAWMIITMVVLVEAGYTTLKEVKEQTDRLNGQAARCGK